MRSSWKVFVVVMVAFLLLAFPRQVSANPIGTPPLQDSPQGKVVFGGSYRLGSGQVLNGGLVIFGGQGMLEEGSTVNGDVLLTGGSLSIEGEINGDLVAIGGSVDMGDNAVIRGDVNTIGAAVSRSDGALVEGTFSFEMPGEVAPKDAPPLLPPPFRVDPMAYFSKMWRGFQPVRDILWKGFQALALAALATVLMLFLQQPTERIASTLVAQPVLSGGLGLLTMIVAPALCIVLILTLILSPLGILGLLAIGLAILLGWIAIGYEVGARISKLANKTWAAPITAGLGTLALTLLANLIGIIPCIGWVLPALIAMVGLGAVVISRFGTVTYDPGVGGRLQPRGVREASGQSFEEQSPINLLKEITEEKELPGDTPTPEPGIVQDFNPAPDDSEG